MPNEFRLMPAAQRARVLAWAKSHDWGMNARFDGDTLAGVECVWVKDGVSETERATITTLSDLRAWAGY